MMKFSFLWLLVILFQLESPVIQESAIESDKTSKNQVIFTDRTDRVRFLYKGTDVVMEFCLEPNSWFWGPIIVKMNMRPIATILTDAGPVFSEKPASVEFLKKWVEENRLHARWKVQFSKSSTEIHSIIELRDKNLIVEYNYEGRWTKGFNYGDLTGLREPELLPILDQASSVPTPTLTCKGLKPFTVSFRIDSNSSSFGTRHLGSNISNNETWKLGRIDYDPFPSEWTEKVKERFTLAFSPVVEPN
jgi:hypothetical protein